ncbi:MAG: hypothetical protein AAF696_02550 [Bacteroidota bacterium]
MGLDISLIKIRKEKTRNLSWFAVEDCPELAVNYADYALKKEVEYEGEEKYSLAVYYYEEISHQRKGVKDSFFDRYEADVFIQSKYEFEELRTYIMDEYRASFERDFVGKFREGENLILMEY